MISMYAFFGVCYFLPPIISIWFLLTRPLVDVSDEFIMLVIWSFIPILNWILLLSLLEIDDEYPANKGKKTGIELLGLELDWGEE